MFLLVLVPEIAVQRCFERPDSAAGQQADTEAWPADEFQFKWAKVLKFSENKAELNLLLSASVMDEKNSFHQPGMSGVVKTSATLRTPSTVNAVKKKQMLRIQEMIKKK